MTYPKVKPAIRPLDQCAKKKLELELIMVTGLINPKVIGSIGTFSLFL
jgi:hypothetical protein